MELKNRFLFEQNVRKAIAAQDFPALKKLLPTPQKLVGFKTTANIPFVGQGGETVLHIAARTTDNSFLKKILQDYFSDQTNPEEQDLKKRLLLARNDNGRLAADFSFFKQFVSEITRAYLNEFENPTVFFETPFAKKQIEFEKLPDTRTQKEIDLFENYLFLKSEIKKMIPEPTRQETLDIPKRRKTFDLKKKKITFLDPLGRHLMSRHAATRKKNTYPIIRLRQVKGENIPENYLELRRFSKTKDFSLMRQLIETVDFPDDWSDAFSLALNRFEKEYKEIENDPENSALTKLFSVHNGFFVFEDDFDSSINTNIENGSYLGYQITLLHNNRQHPLVVLQTLTPGSVIYNSTLRHELFHATDFIRAEQLTFSHTDIAFLAFFLTRFNPRLQPVLKNAFSIVESEYAPDFFNIEMSAQIMGRRFNAAFKGAPLMRNLRQTAQIFAKAQLTQNYAVLNRIQTAMDTFPHKEKLFSLCSRYHSKLAEFYAEKNRIAQLPTLTEKNREIQSRQNFLLEKKIVRYYQRMTHAFAKDRAFFTRVLKKRLSQLNADCKRLLFKNPPHKKMILSPFWQHPIDRTMPEKVLWEIEQTNKKILRHKTPGGAKKFPYYLALLQKEWDKNISTPAGKKSLLKILSLLNSYASAQPESELPVPINLKYMTKEHFISGETTRYIEHFSQILTADKKQKKLFHSLFPKSKIPLSLSLEKMFLTDKNEPTSLFLQNMETVFKNPKEDKFSPQTACFLTNNFSNFLNLSEIQSNAQKTFQYFKQTGNLRDLYETLSRETSLLKMSRGDMLEQFEITRLLHAFLKPQTPLPEYLKRNTLKPHDFIFNAHKKIALVSKTKTALKSLKPTDNLPPRPFKVPSLKSQNKPFGLNLKHVLKGKKYRLLLSKNHQKET